MSNLRLAFGFGLVTGSALAFGYVVVRNWRVLSRAVGRPEKSRESLILLAGPVLLLILVQGLRILAPISGTTILLVLLAGLLADPAGLPLIAIALYRRLRSR